MPWKFSIFKKSGILSYLAALDALGSEFILVALGTIDIVLLRNEGLCSLKKKQCFYCYKWDEKLFSFIN
jgi:hypothetical protein